MRTKVFITIDVECGEFSPDYEGCIWGRLGNLPGEEYGVPLILDLLNQTSIKAVFFVEALSSFRHGIANLKSIVERILSDGHEIQLHIHPSLRHPKRKPETEIHIGRYSLSKQIDFVNKGVEILETCGVGNISAFRAGGFGANNDTLVALERCGFSYDSSYNLNYINSSCRIGLNRLLRNDAFPYGNIVEFPVTCFRNPLSSKIPFRHLQITAASAQETKKALLLAHEEEMRAVTILLHSFEFISYFNKERTVGKPTNINIRRFAKLLDFLSSNAEMFDVSSYNDLSSGYTESVRTRKDQSDFVPELPLRMKIGRQIEQLITRF